MSEWENNHADAKIGQLVTPDEQCRLKFGDNYAFRGVRDILHNNNHYYCYFIINIIIVLIIGLIMYCMQ